VIVGSELNKTADRRPNASFPINIGKPFKRSDLQEVTKSKLNLAVPLLKQPL
jgi:hypothetical protein